MSTTTSSSDGQLSIKLEKTPSNLVAYKEYLLNYLNGKEGYSDIASAIEHNDSRRLTIQLPPRPKKSVFLFPDGNPLDATQASASSTGKSSSKRVSTSPTTTSTPELDREFTQYALAEFEDAIEEWKEHSTPLRLRATNITIKTPVTFSIIQRSFSSDAKEIVEADSDYTKANDTKDIMLLWEIILKNFTHQTNVSSQITVVSQIIALNSIRQDDNETLESLKTKHTTHHKLLHELKVDINADTAYTELFIDSLNSTQYNVKKYELRQLFLEGKIKTFSEAYDFILHYRNAARSDITNSSNLGATVIHSATTNNQKPVAPGKITNTTECHTWIRTGKCTRPNCNYSHLEKSAYKPPTNPNNNTRQHGKAGHDNNRNQKPGRHDNNKEAHHTNNSNTRKSKDACAICFSTNHPIQHCPTLGNMIEARNRITKHGKSPRHINAAIDSTSDQSDDSSYAAIILDNDTSDRTNIVEQIHASTPSTDIFIGLDSCASASLINIDNLLTNEKDIPTKSIRGIGGHILPINQQGILGIFGPAYKSNKASTNVISFGVLRDACNNTNFRISYDHDNDTITFKSPGKSLAFRRYQHNIYSAKLADLQLLLSNTEEPTQIIASPSIIHPTRIINATKWDDLNKIERANAELALEAYAQLGRPSVETFSNMLKNNRIIDAPFTNHDFLTAVKIVGPDPYRFLGKNTQTPSPEV